MKEKNIYVSTFYTLIYLKPFEFVSDTNEWILFGLAATGSGSVALYLCPEYSKSTLAKKNVNRSCKYAQGNEQQHSFFLCRRKYIGRVEGDIYVCSADDIYPNRYAWI